MSSTVLLLSLVYNISWRVQYLYCIDVDDILLFLFYAGFVKIRYVFAILGFILMAIVYGLKVNLSVAIVGMRNHTAEKSGSLNITHSDCPDHVRDNTTVKVSFHKGSLQKTLYGKGVYQTCLQNRSLQ
jgi:hypothetical protein